jgi:hypothetical protein
VRGTGAQRRHRAELRAGRRAAGVGSSAVPVQAAVRGGARRRSS